MNELVARLSPRALVALAVAVLAPLLEITGFDPPGRLLLAVAFILLVPGVAAVELLRLPSAHVSWCLAIALSIAVNILAAQLQLTLHSWHPLIGHVGVALISVVLLVVAVRTAPRKAATRKGAAKKPAAKK